MRTIQSRFLLPLTTIVAETIIGVIARAQERYEVSVIDMKLGRNLLVGTSWSLRARLDHGAARL